MNVVVRGVLAAALGVYASLHLTQALAAPDGPAWLAWAFAATAVAAIVLAVGAILVPEWLQPYVDLAAGGLALGSLAALLLSLTTGFFGVTTEAIRVETALVVLAEVLVLGAIGVQARFADQAQLQEVRASR